MHVVKEPYRIGIAVLRIGVGIIFLWAGLEKLLAPEAFSAAGFLQFGTGGSLGWPFVSGEVAEGTIYNPTNDFWVALAGNETAMSIINILVPWGQVGIGLGLILGLLTRFSAAMGALMMLFFFIAAWDFAYGIVNQHLAYALVTAFLGLIGAGNYYGADRVLGEEASPWVRRWLLSGTPGDGYVAGDSLTPSSA
ncbi:MAG TPA: DoxX family membrane protein [Candidatus Limnocylindria bacterium]